MEKNGNRPKKKSGGPSSPPLTETSFENPPEIPEPPVGVAVAKLPRLALANRSPLSVQFRHLQPSWRAYIQWVDLAARNGDTAMQRVRDCYQALPAKEKLTVWPEQLAEMAGITPAELYGAVCRTTWEAKAAESSMISAIAHPEMLLKTIQFAKKEENGLDRERYFRMTGSLPDRKGSSINIYAQATGQIAEVPLPSVAGKARLKTFDAEVIDMDRELADPPFLVKARDVPSEDH